MKNGLISGPANKETKLHKKSKSTCIFNTTGGLSILDKDLSERFAIASSQRTSMRNTGAFKKSMASTQTL